MENVCDNVSDSNDFDEAMLSGKFPSQTPMPSFSSQSPIPLSQNTPSSVDFDFTPTSAQRQLPEQCPLASSSSTTSSPGRNTTLTIPPPTVSSLLTSPHRSRPASAGPPGGVATTPQSQPIAPANPLSPLGPELGRRQNRHVYFITLSRADTGVIPTQNEFAKGILDVLSELKLMEILQRWVACKEQHADGSWHYHMAIHLSKQRKWVQIKDLYRSKTGFELHFSAKSYGYAKAYNYVTKSGASSLISHSPNHEHMALIRKPQTEKCMAANVQRGQEKEKKKRQRETSEASASSRGKSKKEQPQDLRHKDVTRLIVEKRIGTYQHLQGLAEVRRRLDQWDLFNYLAVHSKVRTAEMIERVWSTMQAPEDIAQINLPRITVLENARSGECVSGCDGKWKQNAGQIIEQNPLVDGKRLKKAIRDNVDMGRCKGQTVFLIGPKDCGKSFLLLPLELLFKTFSNPTRGSYNWVGIQDSECIFLNDFRWDKDIIDWSDFLRLLAGERLWFEMPKNLFPTNYLLDENNTIPIFGTGKARTQWRGAYQAIDISEDQQLDCRISYFDFTYSIPSDKIARRGSAGWAPACPKCFAEFVMEG